MAPPRSLHQIYQNISADGSGTEVLAGVIQSNQKSFTPTHPGDTRAESQIGDSGPANLHAAIQICWPASAIGPCHPAINGGADHTHELKGQK